MYRESELTHPPDIEIIDDENGKWWMVWNEAEGFDPLTYAIKADSEQSAEEVWEEQVRNRGTDTTRLVTSRLKRGV